MARYTVLAKVAGDDEFPYIDVGSGYHGRVSFRLWVSHKLIQKTEDGGRYIDFPVEAYIKKTEKGSLVLKPSDEHVVFDVYVKCGYRGGSGFEILSPYEASYDYEIYHSPVGRCGISNGALVVVRKDDLPLKVRWHRNGRLYGAPAEGIRFYHADGRVDELDMLPDGLEAVEELKKELEG